MKHLVGRWSTHAEGTGSSTMVPSLEILILPCMYCSNSSLNLQLAVHECTRSESKNSCDLWSLLPFLRFVSFLLNIEDDGISYHLHVFCFLPSSLLWKTSNDGHDLWSSSFTPPPSTIAPFKHEDDSLCRCFDASFSFGLCRPCET